MRSVSAGGSGPRYLMERSHAEVWRPFSAASSSRMNCWHGEGQSRSERGTPGARRNAKSRYLSSPASGAALAAWHEVGGDLGHHARLESVVLDEMPSKELSEQRPRSMDLGCPADCFRNAYGLPLLSLSDIGLSVQRSV